MIMKSTGKQLDNQPTGQTQQSDENLQEQISCRAYELYLERGEQSDAIQNWLDAEKEILGAQVQPTSEQALAASAGREI
jgi:DNA-binding SARP family transcriptional activator